MFNPSATHIITCEIFVLNTNPPSYLPGATPAQISGSVELYLQDPAQPIAASEGDFVFIGLRRNTLPPPKTHVAGVRFIFSFIFVAHGVLLQWASGVKRTQRPSFLVNLNTLDPNESAAPKAHRANASVFWPKWQTPSAKGSSSLLILNDPAVVNITADNFRAEPIQFLLQPPGSNIFVLNSSTVFESNFNEGPANFPGPYVVLME
ncbi:hypothetical protein C8R44DRAFT_736828 [Mycena epipterygia]|nr:hypothetical protein C8R44DRAFT_736828 [Mycena epipterygia]